MAYTTIVSGTNITSSWANANVRDQVVSPFGSTAARTAAITAPIAGMVSTLTTNAATEGIEFYNSAGQWRKPWNMPFGVVSSALSIASSSAVSSETVVASGTSFTAVANRYYRWTFTTTAVGIVDGDLFQIKFRRNNTSGTTDYTQRFAIPATPFQTQVTAVAVFSPGAVTFTPVVTFERVTGSGTAATVVTTQIVIEDIGPSGAPA
jgi:hypothetical protein